MQKGLIFFLLIFAFLQNSFSQTEINFEGKEKLNPAFILVLNQIGAKEIIPESFQFSRVPEQWKELWGIYEGKNNEIEFSVTIFQDSYTKAELLQKGFRIGSVVGKITTARLTLSDLKKFLKLEKIYQISLSSKDKPLLDIATSDSVLNNGVFLGANADSLQTLGFNGENVLVGIVDVHGIAFDHLGFRDDVPDTSRILYIWDQTQNSGTPPNGFSYGSKWTRSQIDAGVSTQSPGGHGNAVAGIAVGDGSDSTALAGFAPKSKILYVKSPADDAEEIDAFVWMTQIAQDLGLPISIVMSLGGHSHAHDGTRAVELVMDTLADEGVVFSLAAGNSGSSSIHSQKNILAAGSDSLTFTIGNSDNFAYLNCWYNSPDSIEIYVETPTGILTGPFLPGIDLAVQTSDGEVTVYSSNYSAPENGDHQVYVVIDSTQTVLTVGGNWKVILNSINISDGQFDAWGMSGASFINSDIVSAVTITTPSTAKKIFSVGAYTASNGNFSSGSSRGPTRDGFLKPRITAATSIVTTNTSLGYSSFGGTSASAPCVGGAVALLLQIKPDLDFEEADSLLALFAYSDQNTTSFGNLPNTSWGSGKLNVLDAGLELLGESLISDLQIEMTSNGTKLTWSEIFWATSYKIYRAILPSNSPNDYSFVQTTTSTEFTDSANTNSDKYFYIVTAVK
ncbi:MAG: hypothetical protein DWQ06_06795 [Calditrichaeota bacterium]|nr:MAG: hypothetical protein DWQ06_06795 [Calditrichota bacterium]